MNSYEIVCCFLFCGRGRGWPTRSVFLCACDDTKSMCVSVKLLCSPKVYYVQVLVIVVSPSYISKKSKFKILKLGLGFIAHAAVYCMCTGGSYNISKQKHGTVWLRSWGLLRQKRTLRAVVWVKVWGLLKKSPEYVSRSGKGKVCRSVFNYRSSSGRLASSSNKRLK